MRTLHEVHPEARRLVTGDPRRVASTAWTLGKLASVLYAQGDLATTRPLFERSLAILERVLGPYHLDKAQTLNNLASLSARMTHPDTTAIRDNVAKLARRRPVSPAEP